MKSLAIVVPGCVITTLFKGGRGGLGGGRVAVDLDRLQGAKQQTPKDRWKKEG